MLSTMRARCPTGRTMRLDRHITPPTGVWQAVQLSLVGAIIVLAPLVWAATQSRWVVWGLMLMLTNGMSTLVSRARNTPSYWYHGVCATMNHATWFIVQVLFVGVAIDIGAFRDWQAASFAWAFYTVCSTVGSITVHYVSIRFLEKGTRRVGAYTGESEQ